MTLWGAAADGTFMASRTTPHKMWFTIQMGRDSGRNGTVSSEPDTYPIHCEDGSAITMVSSKQVTIRGQGLLAKLSPFGWARRFPTLSSLDEYHGVRRRT